MKKAMAGKESPNPKQKTGKSKQAKQTLGSGLSALDKSQKSKAQSPISYPSNLCEALKLYRSLHKITQKMLATQLGITPAALWAIEKGQSQPKRNGLDSRIKMLLGMECPQPSVAESQTSQNANCKVQNAKPQTTGSVNLPEYQLRKIADLAIETCHIFGRATQILITKHPSRELVSVTENLARRSFAWLKNLLSQGDKILKENENLQGCGPRKDLDIARRTFRDTAINLLNSSVAGEGLLESVSVWLEAQVRYDVDMLGPIREESNHESHEGTRSFRERTIEK